MKTLLTLFVLLFSSSVIAEINDKEFLSAYNKGCLKEDSDPLTNGEQFLACGCLTNEISKQYSINELRNDDNYVEREKFNKIAEYCISVILDYR